jgi:D-aminoacyl-tRNA deacylase
LGAPGTAFTFVAMRVVVQRVSEASVRIAGKTVGHIEAGLLVLLGIEDSDGSKEVAWMSSKLVQLRIFDDEAGVMNKSVKDIGGSILLVSQFTLYADARKGNRPSYIRASKPPHAIPVYEEMIRQLEKDLGSKIATGIFGADMKVSLVNEGPVTIIIDSAG